MRVLILLLVLLAASMPAFCQQEFLRVGIDTTDETSRGYLDSALYSKAIAAFDKGNYAQAEHLFRRVFASTPIEDCARYLYYSLYYQGLDLEAERFRMSNPDYTSSIPPQKIKPEALYAEGGPRISGNKNAGNIYY